MSRASFLMVALVVASACSDDGSSASAPATLEPTATPEVTEELDQELDEELDEVLDEESDEASTPEPTSAPATLAALLPDAPTPVTLRDARSLAARSEWAQAAAVYDSLLAQTPRNARYLAGRGYALLSWEDPRALGFARQDLEQALTLSEGPLAATTHYNLGRLEERADNTSAALLHYEQAYRLRESRGARDAIERLGGTLPTPSECAFAPSKQALRVDSLVAAYQAILTHSDLRAREEEPPTSEAEAADSLGIEGDGSAPFLSLFAATDDVETAHLIVPANPGYWLARRVIFGNGPNARCPDEVAVGEVRARDGVVRARLHISNSFWNDCDYTDDDCLNGCFWDSREDVEVLLNPATGQYISVGATSFDAAHEYSGVLPMVRSVDGRASARGCGDAALP